MPILNARTTQPDRVIGSTTFRPIDVFNVIRENASAAYRDQVPKLTGDAAGSNIVAVGQAIMGNPGYLNEFLSSMVNRIALVKTESLMFHNMFAPLKKGTVELGSIVNHQFVELIAPTPFNRNIEDDDGNIKLLKKSPPSVKGISYAPNSLLQYPITIDYRDIERAMTTFEGVNDLIDRIIGQLSTSAEYADFQLFNYIVRRAILTGEVAIQGVDPTDADELAVALRQIAGVWSLPSTKYNREGVRNTTPADQIYVLMSAKQRAKFDVGVLARAFNMDKADFIGRIVVVNEFGEFDNEFFESVYSGSEQMKRLTAEELELLDSVVCFVADADWFQVYDNSIRRGTFDNQQGLYMNSWLTIERTYASSPFANAVAIIDSTKVSALPATLQYVVNTVSEQENGTFVSFDPNFTFAGITPASVSWVQTEQSVEDFIAVQEKALFFGGTVKELDLVVKVGDATYTGTIDLVGDPDAEPAVPGIKPGDTITITKQ